MKEIIPQKRSLIIACDVCFKEYHGVLRSTHRLEGVGGYKIGFDQSFEGLRKVVEFTKRSYKSKPLIYDGQKAGTDAPHTGKRFMKILKDGGIDAVILFPFGGIKTQTAWIDAAKESELGVIVGGLPSWGGFLRSENGYIADEAVEDIYMGAITSGVRDFVLPGTKNRIKNTKRLVDMIKKEVEDPVFYFVGIGSKGQGGNINEVKEMNLERYHLIVGRDIHQVKGERESQIERNITNAAIHYINQINF